MSEEKKKVLVSGIKPTGVLHIGNYFGAMRQNIELGNNDEYESYVFIADYHALTSMRGDRTEKLKSSSFNLACAYLALGLDTSKVSLFKQSSVPEVTELTCIFNNVVTVPYLMRAHAFKDHEAKNKEVNVGLFEYPILMASDILIYHADIVPVGSDQKQHIEYARDIAGYFNRGWNAEYFKEPKELILETVATIPGIDGRKMSKSYENIIPLFGSDEEITKAVMAIVTDSKRPEEHKNADENTIFNIHKLFLDGAAIEQLRARFEQGGYGYKEAKESCRDAIIAFIAPRREKYDYYQAHPEEVEKILAEGGAKAKQRAEETMYTVRRLVGLV